ncbi:glycosyltransferase [Bremerella cremea]|uniref:Glycosyltransferase n=1 Tax=Bremerella cremea TaxID=1031537 RepID=A0A368KXB4_9BACT|nr:glycosyltransferase [Bremerella cremea]RCS54295.1 glycosyltransferase [Bremerella cremea]
MESVPDHSTDLPKCILVVPCYNEEKRLPTGSLEIFRHQHPNVKFLFVNDGSHDGTQSLLESLKNTAPESFDVVMLDRNRGKAEAIRCGMREAIARKPVYVGFWDADLSTPLDEVPRFLQRMQQDSNIEMVIGSRVQLLGREISRRLTRHYLGRIFATLASLSLGLPVYDTQCGAKLFRVTPALSEVFDKPFASRWVFDVELLDRFLRLPIAADQPPRGQQIVEVPLQKWTDVAGSKLGTLDCLQAAFDLLRLAFRIRARPR